MSGAGTDWRTTYAIAIRLARALALGVIATSNIAIAQVNGEDNNSPATTSTEQTNEAARETQATLEDEEADEDEPDTSPYDYRSSEEISEDRSVSFPVDI